MTVLREWWRRLWGALRRNPADHDLERELRFHLEQAEEELRGQGHSRAEAARLARARLGGVPQTMEALRDQRGLPWLDDLRIDLRIGMRGLARRPGFTATAALALSIGIGATAAVATVANGLLFQPLPVPDPVELVVVSQLDEHTAEFLTSCRIPSTSTTASATTSSRVWPPTPWPNRCCPWTAARPSGSGSNT